MKSHDDNQGKSKEKMQYAEALSIIAFTLLFTSLVVMLLIKVSAHF